MLQSICSETLTSLHELEIFQTDTATSRRLDPKRVEHVIY